MKKSIEIDISTEVPTKLGTPWEGGYFGGILTFNGDVYGQAVAAKALGEFGSRVWHTSYDLIPGVDSFYDGLSNTKAMAEAGSEIAQEILDLRIGGHDDWHIPARDQLEPIYRGLKPTADENWVFRNGDNPSTLPVGYPYTVHLPGQTEVELFRKGGAEAFEASLYFTSTQFSASNAWFQYFVVGTQYLATKDRKAWFRAVRMIKVS